MPGHGGLSGLSSRRFSTLQVPEVAVGAALSWLSPGTRRDGRGRVGAAKIQTLCVPGCSRSLCCRMAFPSTEPGPGEPGGASISHPSCRTQPQVQKLTLSSASRGLARRGHAPGGCSLLGSITLSIFPSCLARPGLSQPRFTAGAGRGVPHLPAVAQPLPLGAFPGVTSIYLSAQSGFLQHLQPCRGTARMS